MTGYVLFEKDADVIRPMASTTKLFTALMVRELCALSEVVTVSAHAAATEGSSANLQEGEKITVEQLLYALLLSSGNDAAQALAEYACSGDSESFVRYMNQRAAQLGLIKTSFANPSGLPDDSHYSTAREMAKIGQLANKDTVLSRIMATKSITFKTVDGTVHSYTNHNSLLRLYEYAVGMKTGYTKAAGRCLVSSANKGGVMLICVTLDAPNDWEDHKTLFDYGFTQVSLMKLKPQHLSVQVLGGSKSQCSVANAVPLVVPTVGEGIEYEITAHMPDVVFAPIQKGQVFGYVDIYYEQRVVAQYALCATEDIGVKVSEAKNFRTEWQRILNLLLP